jgi:hypothetical protein
MEYEFRSGDHVRVGRLFYSHHGIYIDDDNVIQLGEGVLDKANAKVKSTTLAGFSRGSRVIKVDHVATGQTKTDQAELQSLKLSAQRALWLLHNHPSGNYHLIGWNCEMVANWCVQGSPESIQSRKFYFFSGIALAFALLWASEHQSSPKREVVLQLSAGATVALFGVMGWSRGVNQRMVKEIDHKWQRASKTDR